MYNDYQTALIQLSKVVVSDTDLPTLMNQAVMLISKTLGVTYSTVWEVPANGHMPILRASVGWNTAYLENINVVLEPHSLPYACVREASPIVVMDWLRETRLTLPSLFRRSGIVSSIAMAIPGRDTPFGSLSVDVTSNRRFNPQDIFFLQAIANMLALAIEHQVLLSAQGSQLWQGRQLLFRDLHITISQALQRITQHAEGARMLSKSGYPTMAAEAQQRIQSVVQDALDEMRLNMVGAVNVVAS